MPRGLQNLKTFLCPFLFFFFFYKDVVIAVYATVSQLIERSVATTMKLMISAPLLLMMLVLVAIHLLEFCLHQLFCHSLFLQYCLSINANLFKR